MNIVAKLTTSVFLIVFSFAIVSESYAKASLVSLYVSKKIYKIVNPDGSITYSDKPFPGAEELIITTPSNNIPSQAPSNAPIVNTAPQEAISYAVNIKQPENEATIRNNSGRLTIVASIAPAVSGLYQLEINSQIFESPTGIFQLNDMDRGAYQYTVKFTDNSGKIIASSISRNVYLHKASALIN